MSLEDKVHATRLLALHRAEELGNVSADCRDLGISRALRCVGSCSEFDGRGESHFVANS